MNTFRPNYSCGPIDFDIKENFSVTKACMDSFQDKSSIDKKFYTDLLNEVENKSGSKLPSTPTQNCTTLPSFSCNYYKQCKSKIFRPLGFGGNIYANKTSQRIMLNHKQQNLK